MDDQVSADACTPKMPEATDQVRLDDHVTASSSETTLRPPSKHPTASRTRGCCIHSPLGSQQLGGCALQHVIGSICEELLRNGSAANSGA